METYGYLCALLASLLWAFSSVLFARLLARHGALACNLFKVFVAATLFWVTRGAMGAVDLGGSASVADLSWLALSGVAGLALGDLAYFAAIRRIGVRRATLIHGTFPVFLLAFSLIHPEESLGAAEIWGIVLVVVGVSAVNRAREPQPGNARGRGGGVFLGLLAALGQAVGILLARGPLQRVDFVAGSAWRLTGAAVALALWCALTPRGRGLLRQALTETELWRRGVPVVFVGSYLAIACMTLSIAWGKPAVSGTLLSLTPVLVIPFAVLMLGERVSPRTLPGTCIAVLGVILITSPEALDWLRGG